MVKRTPCHVGLDSTTQRSPGIFSPPSYEAGMEPPALEESGMEPRVLEDSGMERRVLEESGTESGTEEQVRTATDHGTTLFGSPIFLVREMKIKQVNCETWDN
jgi:hypothetical protein